ncbi:Retrovirus-related Pol polyprotein from transposon opus [Stylophora pistillata]|uniref:Retrovirus-related Pol polyprotein from transposon opus n=1 Tax=Stylophora pistillata TaxID=50429 RepID=A0A2B4REP7_STYPI|nr:Retrovirus-related Pol polyprotein from transposon opus [Stylophora pistillata]
MDSFHKPSALSLDGNTSQNRRLFKQQFDIYLTASGKGNKADAVKIAILLNFAEDAIEVFNTFQSAEGDENRLDKVLEQFEQYCNSRKNVVFERYQFWQITQKDSETVDQFVTRLKNKVKSCEYPSPVDDMLRDKFVFSIRDLQVKERLLRDEKLTLEKVISMARSSEASKEQIKVMGPMEQNNANPTVNEIRAGGGDRLKKNPSRRSRPGSGSQKGKCTFCGSSHAWGSCLAFGKKCDYYQKKDHFANVCRKRLRDFGGKTVHAVVESECSDNEADLLTFSVEFSAEDASKDDGPVDPRQSCQGKAKLKVYDGRRITPCGKVSLTCEYKGKFTVMDFILVEQDPPSTLGLNSCLDLGFINRIYRLEEENLESEYADVFEGLDEIKGVQYKIQIDPSATPIVYHPRRVPVALCEPLREELQRMEKLGVIKKCTEPTAWVHGLVVVKKKNNKLRVCMDPSDLNRAVMREHFPMQTVEDVISRMPSAKVFSVPDANHGFWQVKLATDSSKLATFNTPFGRLVLDRCRECNLKLNREKCHFRVSGVHYVGHVSSADGVMPDPNKVEAIIAMPTTANREKLPRFLGVVTYLSKFIPNMSLKSAPLRQLLQNDVEWSWEQAEDDAFTSLKNSISSALVLKFFDLKEPVTMSVDVSSKGVSAVFLQNDRPVAYASKALTPSQENYAQMVKKMLAIVFWCERFHDYLYGQREITVESDHKSFEAILKKPIHQAFLRLQRMILRIKPYAVKLRDGTESDPELQQLQKVVMSGWPQTKVETPVETRPYWNYRDEISCYEGLMFKGNRIIVPHSLRPEIFNAYTLLTWGYRSAEREPEVQCFGQSSVIPLSGMDESPAELLMSRKLRTRLPTSKSPLESQPRSTSQIRHNLLTRQQHKKVLYDRGSRPLSKLHEGEPVRMKQGREWTPAVVIRQHHTPRSYIVVTPDGTQMRRNRFHLQSIKEEASQVRSPAPS